eukprot:g4896.t1
MFSAGVLLSAAIVHQLADTQGSALNAGKVPWANFACGATFLLLLVLEESGHGRKHVHRNVRGYGHSDNSTHGHSHSQLQPSGGEYLEISKTASPPRGKLEDGLSQSLYGSMVPCSPGGHHHDMKHITEHLHGSNRSFLSLFFALIFHSLLLGFSITVARSNIEYVELVIAVMAHKVFAGISLGGAAANMSKEWRTMLKISAGFAISAPLGMIIGMFVPPSVADTPAWNNYIADLIKAVVAGVFLYISALEIGAKELLQTNRSEISAKRLHNYKLLFYTIGFLAMSSIAFFV